MEQAMLAEARTEVAHADHKASAILAVSGVGFGALFGGFIAGDWEPSKYTGAAQAAWWPGSTLAIASVICAALAVWPRYDTSDGASGVTYWGHAALFKTLEEFGAALDGNPANLQLRTRHQLFRLSHIVARKYHYVRISMLLATGAICLLLLAVPINAITRS